MAMLERLTVRGIRNFGVDAEDEQKIVFSSPLTLILGQNGSGKTTIIECIKYALTGELPPNTKNGVGFINSPDVLHISESLGNVKLRLKNSRGIETTICRSAKVIKKNQKQQFKSLDATITLNENSREVMISKRNNDATEDMCTAMGVSKAIMNHVLFCHQEEANWPLGTDGELMTKFDQIFGTTEYNNALDKMRGMRKKYDIIIKDKKVTLKELEMLKLEADRKNMDINKYEDEKQQMATRYDQCKVDITPLNEELRKVTETGEKLSSITASKTKAETELKNQVDNAQQLSSKIKEIFEGSEAELEEKINVFLAKKLEKQDHLEDNELSLNSAEGEYSQCTKRVEECDRKLHSMMQDREREQDLYAEKADYIEKLCDDLNITVDFDIKNSNDRAAALVPNIRSAMAKESEHIQEIRANNEKEDAEQEKEIRQHREQSVKIKSEIDLVTKQLNESETASDQQKSQLRLIEKSGSKLVEIRSKIAGIKDARQQLQTNLDSQGMREEIAQHRKDKEELAAKLEEVNETIDYLTSISTTLANFTTKKKQLEKQEAEVKRIKNKHVSNFQRLFPNNPIDSQYKKSIDNLITKLSVDSNKLDAKIRLKDNLSNKLLAQIQGKKEDLKNLEKEHRQLEEKLDRVCEQTPYEEVLATVRENVDKYQMEHSSFKSSEVFYKKYIKQVQEMNDPCCPLCHKDLAGNEARHLTAELNEKIENLPMNIEQSGKLFKEENSKLETLLGLRSSKERIDKLESELIPKFKEDIKKLDKDLAAAKDEIKKTDPELKEVKERHALAQSMVGDMSMLDGAISDVEQIRHDLKPMEETIAASGGQNDTNLEDLQKQRKELTEREKFLSKEIARKEKILADKMEELHKLQQKEMELKQTELQLQSDLQKCDSIKNRVKELDEQIKQFKEKKTACDQSLIPIEAKIKHAEEKRRRTKTSNTDKLNNAMKRYDGFKKDYESIDRVSNDLKKLAALNLTAGIERQRDALNRLKEEQKNCVKQIETFREKIKSLTKEIADQQNTERDLNDNLELKKIQKKITQKERELAQLRKDEQEVDFAQIMKKKAKLSLQLENLVLERERIKGQMDVKQSVIDNLRSELNQPKYRDSVRNYKKVHFENIVLNKTVEDLTTYCETLEKALTKFHSDKMQKINEFIRDLWRSIYKGNDIDYIQINTEEVKGTTKRRSYTYRVVASKNDSFMDFRGQSSAGQRVLACLIIRMALAETFSGHCGVLALDEPTTNLDRPNIIALCEALNKIVEDRETQRNFMLIVITHDEEFIKTLGRITNYWRVCRDENGKSRIEKYRVN